MLGCAEVAAGVLIPGRIAAADVPTSLTHTQVYPLVAKSNALGAYMLRRGRDNNINCLKMSAKCHSKARLGAERDWSVLLCGLKDLPRTRRLTSPLVYQRRNDAHGAAGKGFLHRALFRNKVQALALFGRDWA